MTLNLGNIPARCMEQKSRCRTSRASWETGFIDARKGNNRCLNHKLLLQSLFMVGMFALLFSLTALYKKFVHIIGGGGVCCFVIKWIVKVVMLVPRLSL